MTRIISTAALALLVACSGSQTQTDNPTGGPNGGGAGDAGTSAASTSASGDGSTGETTSSTSGGAAGTGGASAGTGGATDPQTPAAMVAAADATRGAKLFEENHCKGCHGTRAEPGKKFTNVFKIDWTSEKKVQDAFDMIKK